MSFEESRRAVFRALAGVREPASGRDLVTAGLIQSVENDGQETVVAVELEGAPEARLATVEEAVRAALAPLPELGRVEVRFVSAASPPRRAAAGGAPRRLPMAGDGRPAGSAAGPGGPGHAQGIAGRQELPGVRHIVAVASGKGGVGKSTVCVNLALALAQQGARVGLLDADIYGPSIPLMMDVNRRPEPGLDNRIAPLENHGLKLMSLGFLLDESQPVIWRGPMVQGVIRQFLHEVAWGELDYLMIDLPPGTGDAQLTLVQSVALSGAIVVTTPSDLALLDAAKGLNMFRTVKVPVLGIVENMSYFVCPHCDERTDVFSARGGARVASKLGTPFLGEIPLELAIRKGGDEGRPVVVADPKGREAAPFLELATAVRRRLEGDPGEKKGFFASLLSRR